MYRDRRRRVILTTIFISTLIAPILALVFYGYFIQNDSLFFLRKDIAGVPTIIYAMITVGPIGLIVGLLAVRLCTQLLESGTRTASKWLSFGTLSGVGLGVLAALLFLLLGGGFNVKLINVGLLTGLICGLTISLFWWKLSQQETLKNGSAQISR